MLRSKQEVDKYVSSILCSLRDERERLNKHYQIARMYVEIKEYDVAKRYLEGYITHRDDFAPAFKLMGQIMECQGYTEKAVGSYKRSLELDDKQKSVLIKIGELYCNLDVDSERATYWAECVEKSHPNHEVAFRLRQKAIENRKGDPTEGREELELLLSNELVKNPKDVGVRVKLLQLYMNSGRVNEAYEQAITVERTVAFTQSLAWYQCFLDVLQVYKREHEHDVNGVYHQMLIHVLNSLATLTLEQKPVSEAMEVLFRLDQTLYDVDNQAITGDQWTVLLREIQAQLFYHVGTYLLKKAKQGKMSWREATDYASACYLCSATYKPPLRHSPWYAMATEEDKKLLDYWWQAAHYRCSQIGHMINRLSASGGQTWMQRIDGEFCTDQGKQKIFSTVFTLPNMKDKKTSSYLIKNTTYTIIAHEMPREDQLMDYDHVAYGLRADNLHSLVWTALQYHNTRNKTQPDYQMRFFDSLQFGVLNLDSGVLETLSQLDAEVFFLATVYVSALKLEDIQVSRISEPGQPAILPAALMSPLVTPEQNEWWEMARKVATGTAKDQFSKMRLTLQRGLEVVRMVGNHGMTLDLVTHLARTFEQRAEVAKTNMSNVLDLANDIASLEERSKKYWKVTVDMAEKHMREASLSQPKQQLFTSACGPVSEEEHLSILEEGRYHLGVYSMEAGRREEAIEILDKVHMPEASFHQGKLYTQIATHELRGQMLDQTEGEERFKQLGLLTKARDKFYTTLDRLRGDRFHKLNAELANEIEDVECKLNLLEGENAVPRADTSLNGAEVDESVIPHASTMAQMRGLRDTHQGHSLLASTPRRALDMSRADNTPVRNFAKPSVGGQLSSTVGHMTTSHMTPPRLRPSPERLEAQMRQFTHTQDTVVMSLLEELKDRRKEMQQLQEKCVALERDKNIMLEKVYTAEKERERAVIRIERISEQQQDLDDRKKRLQKKEDELEGDKQKLSDSRRDIQLEKDRHAAESRRLEEDWKRLAGDRERMDKEWREVDDKKKLVNRDREILEEEKKKLESEKKKFEDEKEKANQRIPPPAQAATTTGPDQFNLRPPFQQPPYDYLQPGFMHGQFGGYPSPGQPFPGGHGFPGGLPQGFGYPAGTLPPHGAARGTADTRQTQTALQDTEEIYFEDDDDENENNGLVAGQGSLASQLTSNYMFPHNIPPIFTTPSYPSSVPMPGPGFFASPDRGQFGLNAASTAAPVVTVAGEAAPSPLMPGNPILAQTTGALASLLTSSAIVSQVQGAALFSVLADAGTNTGTNTKFPMNMPAVTNTPISSSIATTPATTVAKNNEKQKTEQDKSGQDQQDGEEQNESYNDASNDPHFEPIVSLPQVEVKTGEEGEKTLYECRAKLYRFVDSQWKERGLGQIKILHNESEHKVRIVMRREQVFKVCANHFIKPDMEIKEREDMKGNVLTWRAIDYSDEEARMEQFCLKVKTPEIAQEFKASFLNGCEIMKSSEKIKIEDKEEATASKLAVSSESALPNIAAIFKPAEGSWTCSGCTLVHKPDVILCPACEKPKPGHEAEAAVAAKKKDSQFGSSSFKFGSLGAGNGSSGHGFQFGGIPPPATGLGSRTGSASSFSSLQSGGSFGFAPKTEAQAVAIAVDVHGNTAAVNLVTSIPKPSSSGFKLPTTSVTSSSSASETSKPSDAPLFGGGFGTISMASATGSVSSTTTTTTTASSKHLFGGFTFSQKPALPDKAGAKEADNKKTTVTAEQKSSPFAGFSFGKSEAKSETSGSEKPSIFGGNVTVTTAEELNFASLSKASEGKAFNKKPEFKGFDGTGASVFGGGSPATQKTPTKARTSESEGAETEFEPDVDFKPIVQLEEVEAKTGEEEEEVLFEERSKLFRFDLATKQWKERGIGQLKILKCTKEFKFRIVMRREQVLKLCANHALSQESAITPFEGSDKMFRWMANDYAEEELKQEMLAAKFKTPELALNFKTVFEECVDKLKRGGEQEDKVTVSVPQPVSSEEVSSTQDTADTRKPKASLADMFKPKAGEWECDACLVRNKPDDKKCVSCLTVKPGCEAEVTSTTGTPAWGKSQNVAFQVPTGSGGSPFSFGQKSFAGVTSTTTTTTTPSTGGFQFGAKPDSTTNKPPGSQTSRGFTFGGTPKTTTPEKQGPLSGAFKFGAVSSSQSPGQSPFAFTRTPEKDKEEVVNSTSEGKAVVTSTTDIKAETSSSNSAFGVTNFTFSGLTPLKDYSKPKSPLKSPLKSPGADGEYYQDDGEGEHILFEPIVSLPDDYDHKTGEEDEETIYCRKSKLFRFVENQWKERGVGEIKILKQAKGNKMRLLMRRDQVHKVCLNHALLPDMELTPMTGSKGKAYVWHAEDYADGELVHEKFAIRFKTDIIAREFKEGFDNAKVGKPVQMMILEEESPKKKSECEGDKVKKSSEEETKKEEEQTETKPVEKPKTFTDAFTFKTDDSKPTSTSVSSTTEKSGFGRGFTFGQKTFNFGQTENKPGSSLFGGGGGGSQSTTPAQGFKFGMSGVTTTPTTTQSGDAAKTDTVKSASAASETSARGKSAQKSLLADLLAFGDAALGVASVPSESKEEGEVIFISEKLPTPQQAALAKQYMLPKTFYCFDSDFQGCKGCIGCDPDKFDFNSIGQQKPKGDDVIFLYEEKSSPAKQSLLNKYQLPDNFYSYEHKAGCSGCPGCEQNETEEEIVQAAQAFVTGGRGNVHYMEKELKPLAAADVIVPSQAFVTGDRGNTGYLKELATSTAGDVIVPSQASVTGDRGNTGYLKELATSTAADVVVPSQASVTGDRGNTNYLKELLTSADKDKITKEEADSTTDVSTSKSSPVFGGFGMAGGFDFASIAGKSDETGFSFGKKQEGKAFSWQGAGQSIFTPSPGKSVGGSRSVEEEGEDVEREADVHFDPVVQLPEVEVTTGEESEEILYAQRAKLYRYDNGQWKERGLGEMKILKHRETGKYRLLQRREQVYKICCNQPITLKTKLSPMQTSETAWCWYGMDSSDEESKLEQFALRLKTVELAKEFYDQIEKCKEDLQEQQSVIPTAVESATQDNGGGGDASDHGNEYEEEYEDDEDEQHVLFYKRATMFYVGDDGSTTNIGMGEFSVLMDDDIIAYRINMKTDSKDNICNHVICASHILQKNERKKFAEWTAKDFSTDDAIRRTFRVVFSSGNAVKEFADVFNQGIAMARESEIDEVPDSTSITGELLLQSEK